MTRLEYDLLSDERKDLGLPVWPLLWDSDCRWIQRHTQDELVARVTADRLRGKRRFDVLAGSVGLIS